MSDQDTTIAADGLEQMLDQFNQSTKLRALASSYLDQCQAFEDAAWPLLAERGLENATGDRLDGIGTIFDIPRGGRSDFAYRLALQVELAVLRSNGTEADLLAVVSLYVEAPAFEFVENFPKWVSIRAIDWAVIDATGEFMAASLRRSVSAATTIFYIGSLWGDSDIFTLSSSATALQTSADLGLANDAQTTGGNMAWAY